MPNKPYPKVNERPGQGIEKRLGELELAIMRVAWTRAGLTVRDVLDVLKKKRSLAYTTVMTVMGRLAEKGLLVTEKRGKTYVYRAAQTRAELESRVAANVAHSLITDFGGEIALSQFVKELSETHPDQLARLAELARLAQESNNDE